MNTHTHKYRLKDGPHFKYVYWLIIAHFQITFASCAICKISVNRSGAWTQHGNFE